MPGRHAESRRDRRRRARRKARARRFTASSSAALLAVAGLGALEKLTLPAGSDPYGEPITSEFAALSDDVITEQAADRTPTALARGSDRVSVPPAVEVTVDAGPTYKPPAGESLPAGSGSGKRIVFDITAQQVWLVNADNEVERTYPVSGSRYDQLDPGTYEVFSASRHTTSWTGSETMEYMVRFHRGKNSNIGFHDIPVKTATGEEVQTLSELGTPLSDGCIRQAEDDAKALYEFAPVGSTVVVVRS
ncbi:MAG TPA: L,D-transpeptidase [Jiangellaceae bacterium]